MRTLTSIYKHKEISNISFIFSYNTILLLSQYVLHNAYGKWQMEKVTYLVCQLIPDLDGTLCIYKEDRCHDGVRTTGTLSLMCKDGRSLSLEVHDYFISIKYWQTLWSTVFTPWTEKLRLLQIPFTTHRESNLISVLFIIVDRSPLEPTPWWS